jgi:hypothetical protein
MVLQKKFVTGWQRQHEFNAATPNPEEVDAIEWVSISAAIEQIKQ